MAGLAAVSVVLALDSGAAGAQQAGVRVDFLHVAASPEVVTINNTGPETHVLTGWKLVSDPPDAESFDLSDVGELSPGETVYIQSGPGAGGAFIWSSQFVFRDGDPTDFVRLVDGAGIVVQEVRCASPTTPRMKPPSDASSIFRRAASAKRPSPLCT